MFSIFKNKVFIIGLISAILTSVLESISSPEMSWYVIGFSIASAIFGYIHREAPGKIGTISGIIGGQLAAFQVAHSAPTGIEAIDILKYFIPILLGVLGLYAKSDPNK